MTATYSFADINATIIGPFGTITMSEGGVAKEGIDVDMIDERTTMTMGADGEGFHNAKASKAARITVRLLKTSPVNKLLAAMMNAQHTGGSIYVGKNTISVSNRMIGDDHNARQCAFTKLPPNKNGEEGGMMEWVFNSIKCDSVLGDGSLTT